MTASAPAPMGAALTGAWWGAPAHATPRIRDSARNLCALVSAQKPDPTAHAMQLTTKAQAAQAQHALGDVLAWVATHLSALFVVEPKVATLFAFVALAEVVTAPVLEDSRLVPAGRRLRRFVTAAGGALKNTAALSVVVAMSNGLDPLDFLTLWVGGFIIVKTGLRVIRNVTEEASDIRAWVRFAFATAFHRYFGGQPPAAPAFVDDVGAPPFATPLAPGMDAKDLRPPPRFDVPPGAGGPPYSPPTTPPPDVGGHAGLPTWPPPPPSNGAGNEPEGPAGS